MSDQELKVGLGQYSATDDLVYNQRQIMQVLHQAKEHQVELLILPEAAMCSFAADLPTLRKIAQEQTEGFIVWLSELAQQYQLTIIAGVMRQAPEDDTDSDKRVYNQIIVIDTNGKLICTYNKLHMFDAFHYQESLKVRPGELKQGDEFGIFKLKDFTIGLLNCYDLRFPELSRHLTERGVNVFALSAAWLAGVNKVMHWETLCRARAIENTCYMLACGQGGVRCIGQSLIADPYGLVIARSIHDKFDFVSATIKLSAIEQVRQILPSLINRRYLLSK